MSQPAAPSRRSLAVPIGTARRIGQEHGARRLVVIAIGEDDFSITTWGSTRAECRALARWADSREAELLVGDLAEVRP